MVYAGKLKAKLFRTGITCSTIDDDGVGSKYLKSGKLTDSARKPTKMTKRWYGNSSCIQTHTHTRAHAYTDCLENVAKIYNIIDIITLYLYGKYKTPPLSILMHDWKIQFEVKHHFKFKSINNNSDFCVDTEFGAIIICLLCIRSFSSASSCLRSKANWKTTGRT